MKKKIFLSVVCCFILGSCRSTYGLSTETPVALPKNIILFIGDGMGLSQITAGRIVAGTLALDRFKTVGLLTTHSFNSLITDSAAAGTALSTGVKTYNGVININPNGSHLRTLTENAIEKGMKTGIVVTSSITHATPATFSAHVNSRDKEFVIAEQIAESKINVLLGGGLDFFLPLKDHGLRRDGRNLLLEMQNRYSVITQPHELDNPMPENNLIGLFASNHLAPAGKRKITLPQMTQKAISLLSKSKHGFFLMVEGSQIDFGGHKNDSSYIINEMLEFDNAIAIGLNFAERDESTLIIVTSDHETGGFAIVGGSLEKKVTIPAFATKGHTGTMIPLFAYGPGSSLFGGIHDNTYVGKTLLRLNKPL